MLSSSKNTQASVFSVAGWPSSGSCWTKSPIGSASRRHRRAGRRRGCRRRVIGALDACAGTVGAGAGDRRGRGARRLRAAPATRRGRPRPAGSRRPGSATRSTWHADASRVTCILQVKLGAAVSHRRGRRLLDCRSCHTGKVKLGARRSRRPALPLSRSCTLDILGDAGRCWSSATWCAASAASPRSWSRRGHSDQHPRRPAQAPAGAGIVRRPIATAPIRRGSSTRSQTRARSCGRCCGRHGGLGSQTRRWTAAGGRGGSSGGRSQSTGRPRLK